MKGAALQSRVGKQSPSTPNWRSSVAAQRRDLETPTRVAAKELAARTTSLRVLHPLFDRYLDDTI
jgi:hypothetical protein